MLAAFHRMGRRMAASVGCGAMAQLVARLHGMQKVRGSNPLSSTLSSTDFVCPFDKKEPNYWFWVMA